MPDGYAALTDKEKQTLRLIVRGHDAKSIARHFDLSVHTINERLREARRKLAVPSSREAARLLLEREEPAPDSAVDQRMGEAARTSAAVDDAQADHGPGRASRFVPIATGVVLMSLALAIALVALPQLTPASTQPAVPAAQPSVTDAEVESSARRWLALVDQGRWEESWKGTGAQFRELNTVQVWASASEKARTPLGATLSRTLISQEWMPAPPHGYAMIKFRTSFASKPDAVETLSLSREDGTWRVVGILID